MTDLPFSLIEQAHPQSEYSVISFQQKVHSSIHKSGLLSPALSILFCVTGFFSRLKFDQKISAFPHISKWYPEEANQNDIVKQPVTAESSRQGAEHGNSHCY